MKSKQGIALLLALAMLITTTLQGTVVNAQEVKEVCSMDMAIKPTIEASWSTGENICIEITNKSEKNIEGWNLIFYGDYPIINIWNGTIKNDDNGLYVISDADWNSEIKPNETISFGFIIEKDIDEVNWLPMSFLFIENELSDYMSILESDWDNDGLLNIEELCIGSSSYDSHSMSNVSSDYEVYSKLAQEICNDNKRVSARIGGKYAVKKAVKWAIKHMDDLVDEVGKLMGKNAAKKLAKNSNKVVKTLNKLLEYEDLAFSTVQDQVRNTLTPLVGYSTASVIALGVRLVLEVVV